MGIPTGKIGPRKWIRFLAERLTPRYQRDFIAGDLQALALVPRLYAWRAAKAIACIIKYQMIASFDVWLVTGEASLFWIAIAGSPFLPSMLLLMLVLAALRVRDAYIYSAEGSPGAMAPEAGGIAIFVFLAETALGWIAPSLVLPAERMIQGAVIGAVSLPAWRMIFRKGEPLDKRPRELQESLVAAWHMNLLWAAAGVVLSLTNAAAVPEIIHGRDFLLGGLPVVLLCAAYRLQKDHFTGMHPRAPLSLFRDARQDELLHQSAMLWFPDRRKSSKLPAYVYAEVLYFVVLVLPAGLAAWRWISGDSSAAQVDWRQLAINVGAMAALAALWIRIKRLNRQTARALRERSERAQALDSRGQNE